MLYILQIIVWPNIVELSVLCYTYYKSLHDKIYWVVIIMLYILQIIVCTKYILSCHYYVIHTTNHCMTKYIWVVQIIVWQNILVVIIMLYILQIIVIIMTKYIWVVIIMLYILQIIVWQNIFELSCYTYYKYYVIHYYVIHTTNHCMSCHYYFINIFELSLLCYTYYKSLYDNIYFSCHYYVIHTTNHCMTKYIWVVIIMLYILQIIVWQNIFELSVLCYTYYKSLYDKIYLSCHYYFIHTTNHCMTKYIWVVIIMLHILQIIVWQHIFELSLLCYTYYKSLYDKVYLSCQLLCYTYYKSLYDKIYLSCHYYVIHTTNHCMTKYIWVVIIILYILQIIAWQNIFELSLLCYTYYKSLYDKIYLSCHYYVIHTTNHCMTKLYIWVVKIYLSCHYYVIHTTNHCMTKYIWVVIIMLFELSLLCYTYYKSLYDQI